MLERVDSPCIWRKRLVAVDSVIVAVLLGPDIVCVLALRKLAFRDCVVWQPVEVRDLFRSKAFVLRDLTQATKLWLRQTRAELGQTLAKTRCPKCRETHIGGVARISKVGQQSTVGQIRLSGLSLFLLFLLCFFVLSVTVFVSVSICVCGCVCVWWTCPVIIVICTFSLSQRCRLGCSAASNGWFRVCSHRSARHSGAPGAMAGGPGVFQQAGAQGVPNTADLLGQTEVLTVCGRRAPKSDARSNRPKWLGQSTFTLGCHGGPDGSPHVSLRVVSFAVPIQYV